jgi:cytochrome c biogenesis protein CcdA
MREKMARLNKAYFLFSFVLFLLFVKIAYSTGQVVIEFFYSNPKEDLGPLWDPSCRQCVEDYNAFLEKNNTINRIQSNYTSQVLVNRTRYYFCSEEGLAKMKLYNITQPNSIVIRDEKGNFTKIEPRDFNETYIRQVIDAYLKGASPPPPPPPPPLAAVLVLAFSFGFLDTFSPCLLALLSFVLSFTIGKTTQFKKGFFYVMTFGIGFVSAAVLLGLTVGLIFSSMARFYIILTWIVCIFALFFGLDLLGFNVLRILNIKFETKPLVTKLSRKYVYTYTGLVLLGFLFYFLDPCIAPIFVSMVPLMLLEYLPLIILVFSLGVILPFIVIGMIAGSISKLVRVTYKHRSKIRAISGLVLIAYALYLIILVMFRL